MPKLIDNYVLNRKIGAGQYGEVFRGYDRATNQQIAVKSIKRENVKGKFKELLESQIKVLKSCQNSHIIKLYDMKKTSNNFYLIMEYCNDGDLETYVKKKKYLIEDQAISIFCEVVHGFEHLYKHKILHRDLKLANILRHDGSTKIADFGFSKILKEEDLAATMLGSPLNMAPEVLQNMEYSNKADIYSLGVCFYWMLFGKPPFNAKNIVQLKDVIMKQQIAFPKNINKVSDMTQQLIKKMLKAKPQQRIGWQQLFEHPIMSYLKKQMQKQMTLTLTMQGSFSENISKLYLSQNLVIIHPAQFKKRQQGVQFTAEVLKEGKKKEFKGDILKKDIKQEEEKLKVKRQPIDKTNSDQLQQKVTEDQKVLNQMQSNTFYLLNERNSIIFILSVINQLRSKKQRKLSHEIVGHLIKQVGTLFKKLQESISEKVNNYKLPYWDQFIYSSSFKNLEHFLYKEQVIVKFQLEKGSQFAKPSTESFQTLVKAYCNNMSDLLKKDGYDEKNRSEWIQLNHLMDISKIDSLLNEEFDFKHYYNDYGKSQIKQLIDKTRQRIKTL